MESIFVIAAVFIVLYLLYNFGFIAIQQKRAVFFTASLNGSSAKFSGCTGKITRIVRFRESGNRVIRFQKSAEKGAISISLFDQHGNRSFQTAKRKYIPSQWMRKKDTSCAF